MKVKTFATTCLLMIMSYHSAAFAQITISANKQNIKQVILQIEKNSEYSFFYSDDFLDLNKTISINVSNEGIETVLDRVFQNTNIKYRIENDKQIVLTVVDKQKTQDPSSESKRKIAGAITDEKGEPLIGASIVVKGTTTGTITDLDGRFTLQASKDDILRISYIGYKPKEVKADEKTELNITLIEDSKVLNDLVVVGFGVQKRVNLTGAVSTISGENFQSRPVQSATQALQGVSPGLRITQSEGLMDNNPSINIRGIGTIDDRVSNAPLILIDGMEGDINTINPQDIENISVLKDAAASSIYGSKAPYGVILVTTKKGVKGKNTFTYTNSFRWNDPILLPNTVNSLDFATYFNAAATNSGSGAVFSADHLQRIQDYLEGKIPANQTIIPNSADPTKWADGYDYGNANTNWNKAIYRNWVLSQEHNLSMNGGGDNIQYYISANYLNMNGLMQFNQDIYNRYSIDAKLTSQLNKYVNLNFNSRFNRVDYGRPSYLAGGYDNASGRQCWPTLPLYDPNGFLYSSPSPALGLRDGGRDTNRTDNLYQQIQLVVTPLTGLTIFGEFNFRLNSWHHHWDTQDRYNHDVNGKPYLITPSGESTVSESQQMTNYYNPNLYAEYYKQFQGGHNFKVMMGVQYIRNEEMNLGAQRDGIIVPGLNVIDLTSGTDNSGNLTNPWMNGSLNDWATAGYYGRLNYDYKERYLVEGNLRYDGTSRYRQNQRWNWYPSFSLGWNIANESFMESLKEHINMLKLRASYGALGNQNTNNWYPTYLSVPVSAANSTWLLNGIRQNTSYAPNLITESLTWERIKTVNAGLDMYLLNNRFSFSGDYYVRYTLDMLGPAPQMPSNFGTDPPLMNNTDLRTNGWELDFRWQDRLMNGLGYSVRVNLSDAKTVVTRYPNAIKTLDLDLSGDRRYYTGQVLGEIWGYETIGIAKTADEMNAHLASLPNGGQQALGQQWTAGDIMYRDLNGDGKVDPGAGTLEDHGDLRVIGNSDPHYLFGIDLSADYKGFDIRAFFQGVLKRDWVTKSYYFWGAGEWGQWWSTCYAEHLDYFRDNPDDRLGLNLDSYYPRPLFGDSKNQQTQTGYLLDASYIRLKNLQLGYTFPKKWTQDVKISNLRVYVSCENIWTGTKLTKIFDPETIGGGWGGSVYPLSKVVSCGLNLSF
ncbi:MAG: TonB-dependent receptor [Candidatus Azobacteroides sp.]|nr:TonB-dependent receptor [Candidatus Azobacteroides sp.]